jgi:hypothetical protein
LGVTRRGLALDRQLLQIIGDTKARSHSVEMLK